MPHCWHARPCATAPAWEVGFKLRNTIDSGFPWHFPLLPKICVPVKPKVTPRPRARRSTALRPVTPRRFPPPPRRSQAETRAARPPGLSCSPRNPAESETPRAWTRHRQIRATARPPSHPALASREPRSAGARDARVQVPLRWMRFARCPPRTPSRHCQCRRTRPRTWRRGPFQAWASPQA